MAKPKNTSWKSLNTVQRLVNRNDWLSEIRRDNYPFRKPNGLVALIIQPYERDLIEAHDNAKLFAAALDMFNILLDLVKWADINAGRTDLKASEIFKFSDIVKKAYNVTYQQKKQELKPKNSNGSLM